MIKVIFVEVDKEPREVSIKNTVEAMQAIVGGYIEPIPLRDGLVVLCNEEGRMRRLPYNTTVCRAFGHSGGGVPQDVVGPFLVCRVNRAGNFCSIEDGDMENFIVQTRHA